MVGRAEGLLLWAMLWSRGLCLPLCAGQHLFPLKQLRAPHRWVPWVSCSCFSAALCCCALLSRKVGMLGVLAM